MTAIVWLRRDLRLIDQAAIRAAAEAGPVIPVYVLDDETPGDRRMGGASRWWLHHSLASMAAALEGRGSRLILRRGVASDVLRALAAATGARAIHAIRHYEPWWRNAEAELARALPDGTELILHDGNYLLPPGTATTGAGTPFRIYTPFARALRAHMPPPEPLPAPETLGAPGEWPTSDVLSHWGLLPTKPDWAKGFGPEWQPGEEAAAARLAAFAPAISGYGISRNLPSIDGSSRLSPHLHFGELSPARVWHAAQTAGQDADKYLGELIWRDFSQNLILSLPDYGRVDGHDRLSALPTRDPGDPAVAADIAAWKEGRTGYPIVDAGMRQLWTTGWMHNRVRMLAASFLVKHLLVDWRVGERFFWDTLVDADYAQNATNWQWVAGSGVDASLFTRIMAPLSQSEKFDAGGYIRRWVPELAGVPDEAIHDPHGNGNGPAAYPAPIIGHREARARALAAYATTRPGP